MLRELYGPGVEKLRIEHMTFTVRLRTHCTFTNVCCIIPTRVHYTSGRVQCTSSRVRIIPSSIRYTPIRVLYTSYRVHTTYNGAHDASCRLRYPAECPPPVQLTELAICMCGVARGMSEWCTLTSSPFPLCCVQTPSKKKVEISTIASNYHIEMNPRSVVTV